jgi:hypothetical protein
LNHGGANCTVRVPHFGLQHHPLASDTECHKHSWSDIMNLASGWSWLASLTTRRAPRQVEPEAADYGTAFGLDMSLSPLRDTELDAFEDGVSAPAPLQWMSRITSGGR